MTYFLCQEVNAHDSDIASSHTNKVNTLNTDIKLNSSLTNSEYVKSTHNQSIVQTQHKNLTKPRIGFGK